MKAEDSKERQEDPEKEARTVFVGNLPVTCKKQELKKIFGDFGKIEAIRFRCAARPDLKTTKKVAVIKGKFHEQSSNIAAYVRFTEKEMAVKATAFNGSLIEGHAVRVDLAAAARCDIYKPIFEIIYILKASISWVKNPSCWKIHLQINL